jgi:hypothetical protein
MKRTIEQAVEQLLAKWHSGGLESITRQDLVSLEQALLASKFEDDELERLAMRAKEAYDELSKHSDSASAAFMARVHLEEVRKGYEAMQSKKLRDKIFAGVSQRDVLPGAPGEEAQARGPSGAV